MGKGLICLICNHWEEKNLKHHLEKIHKLTTKEYKKLYAGSRTMTGHSKRTPDYWMNLGYSEEESLQKVKEFQKGNTELFYKNRRDQGVPEEEIQAELHNIACLRSCRRIEYYLARGYTEEEGRQLLIERQSVLSNRSSRFTGHKHTRDARNRISKKIKEIIEEEGVEKRLLNFYKSRQGHQSGGEIDCFLELKKDYPELQSNIKVSNKMVDMLYGNIIIEYYGDFWHRNPKKYSENFYRKGHYSKEIWERDQKRIEHIESENNQKVFVIWELDWKNERDTVKNKLKEVINEYYTSSKE